MLSSLVCTYEGLGEASCHLRGNSIIVKFTPEHAMKAQSSTLSLTSALDGGGWLTPRPGRFTPLKVTRHSLCMAWWASERV